MPNPKLPQTSPEPIEVGLPVNQTRSVFQAATTALVVWLAGSIQGEAAAQAALDDQPWSHRAQAQEMVELYVLGERVVGLSAGVITPDGSWHTMAAGTVAGEGTAVPDPNTLYEIGSITKVFTGLLLADSVVRGEVQLTDPLSGHLDVPEKQLTKFGEPMRLVHLATHSSGLPRMPGNFGLDATSGEAWRDWGVDDMREMFSDFRLIRQPGKRYSYSNLGYGLLGYVLAERAGADLDRLVGQRLLEPLGLQDTAFALDASQGERFALGHDAILEPAEAWDMGLLAGCGGLKSSVLDLLRFSEAQFAPAGPLAEAIELSQQVQAEFKKGETVMLGWHQAGDGMTLQHSGQTAGYHGCLLVCPRLRVATCVLGNTAEPLIDLLAQQLFNLALGQVLPGPDLFPPVALSDPELNARTGRFAGPPGSTFAIELEALHGKLLATVDGEGQGTFRLLPRTAHRFEYVGLEASVEFEESDSGALDRMRFEQGGLEYVCQRVASGDSSRADEGFQDGREPGPGGTVHLRAW